MTYEQAITKYPSLEHLTDDELWYITKDPEEHDNEYKLAVRSVIGKRRRGHNSNGV